MKIIAEVEKKKPEKFLSGFFFSTA